MNAQPLTPDFIEHEWQPLQSAILKDAFVHLRWNDGLTFDAYALWLAENVEGLGLEPLTRESMMEPSDLPMPADLQEACVDKEGALCLAWSGGRRSRVHPGWLRYVAEQRLLPTSPLPEPVVWTAASFSESPSVDGTDILENTETQFQWLSLLVQFGVGRLTNTPAEPTFIAQLFEQIAPIRASNFGSIFDVQIKPDPDSTAYLGINLGQHTDLPSRESPPGYQFLHCIENTVTGGFSRLTDGLAVVDAIRSERPAAFEALTELDWIFMNRASDAEHRWIGPIIDQSSAGKPLTLRAFYPVRSAPHMAPADMPRAYDSLRVFSQYAHDPRFQIRYPFAPGDLVGFDNHRVLHGRDAFDSNGSRYLRGCYVDHDDIYSRLRVLSRGC